MRRLLLIASFFIALPLLAEEPLSPPAPKADTGGALEIPQRDPARIPTAREAEAMRVRKKSSDQRLGFFVGADANLGKDFYFSNVELTQGGASYTGSSTLNSKQAAGVRVGLELMPDRSFGFQASLAFQTPRNITAINSSLSGVNTAPTVNSNASVQFNFVEVTGLYRWHYLYLPAGLNFSVPFLANMDTSVAQYSVNGMVGGHVGVGGAFYGGLRVELLFITTSMQLRVSGVDSLSTSYNENFGTGWLPTGELRAHWTF